MSIVLTFALIVAAMLWSTRSPSAWPCRSLIGLNLSRSSMSTASGEWLPAERAISRRRGSLGGGGVWGLRCEVDVRGIAQLLEQPHLLKPGGCERRNCLTCLHLCGRGV